MRREQKHAKRAVNIEIASEIVDLIMDLQDEVFKSQQTASNNKLSKNEWREFLDIFKQGRKVSLRNVVKRSNSPEGGDHADFMLHF